ncbi:MAG: ferritin family protein [Candidatus Krumholzibacteria bacterium]|jgi:rubrerythrin|nr:ferritin family protein [Candidatus Krumholzibacteria bacterium]
MEGKRGLTMLEILAIGIKSEIDAVRLYTRMKEMAESGDLKEKMDFLISQEKKHEKILKEVYDKKFPEVALALPPKSIVPLIDNALEGEATMRQLFEVAMKAEKLAEKYYRDLAGKTTDSNAKSILVYMAGMEQSHYAILEAEFRQMEMLKTETAGRFLDSEGLMNIGP